MSLLEKKIARLEKRVKDLERWRDYVLKITRESVVEIKRLEKEREEIEKK